MRLTIVFVCLFVCFFSYFVYVLLFSSFWVPIMKFCLSSEKPLNYSITYFSSFCLAFVFIYLFYLLFFSYICYFLFIYCFVSQRVFIASPALNVTDLPIVNSGERGIFFKVVNSLFDFSKGAIPVYIFILLNP